MMKIPILLWAMLTALAMQAQTNTITTTGSASKEIKPDRIVVNVSMNDKHCSAELPTMEAITAHYISITKSLNVKASENVLIKQRTLTEANQDYHFHTYRLVLMSEADLVTLESGLNISAYEYAYSYHEGLYSMTVEERHFPMLDQTEAEVRELAFKSAETEAKHLAKLAGKKLGAVLAMTEPLDANHNFNDLRDSVLGQTQSVSYTITITFELINP